MPQSEHQKGGLSSKPISVLHHTWYTICCICSHGVNFHNKHAILYIRYLQGASLRGRHTPATLAQEGKIVWSGKEAMIVSESWRLENTRSPATVLQENSPAAARMSIYRACTRYFVVFAMYTYACLEACDYRAFVASMTNRHGHWVCWIITCWMSMGGKTLLNTQQAPAWNMWLKWQ